MSILNVVILRVRTEWEPNRIPLQRPALLIPSARRQRMGQRLPHGRLRRPLPLAAASLGADRYGFVPHLGSAPRHPQERVGEGRPRRVFNWSGGAYSLSGLHRRTDRRDPGCPDRPRELASSFVARGRHFGSKPRPRSAGLVEGLARLGNPTRHGVSPGPALLHS